MQATTLKQIADWCDGTLIQGRPADTIASLSTDSRKLAGGELFLALKGERFDGHRFIQEAGDAGVAAIVVSDLPLSSESFTGGIVHVSDTLTALQHLALRYRRSRPDLFVVGLTGSNGKTSTKDFLSAVLTKSGKVNATPGNLNNHIGLPQTILKTEADDEIGVWEMGMNHPGEIEVLAEIAAPDAAVITNVGTAHIEHMKTREAIAEEKGMLAEAVGPDGFVVLNANDEYTDSIRGRCRARVITAGIDTGDVVASDLKPTAAGMAFVLSAAGESVEVSLPVPGAHMVANAVLAAAVGLERGLSLLAVADALSEARLSGGRLQRREAGGIEFLDDSYNANPDSMRAALATLAAMETQGRRIAVLGRMAELGEHEEREHIALGEAAVAAGIDTLIAVGEAGKLILEGAGEKGGAILWAADHEAAATQLVGVVAPGDIVLVKGSRSSGMEKVIEAFGERESQTN
ncbi:MAG: UDP-N-acetylmuramoyl-tripeptide--D-alanyl-D-alanine ligase [Verrucomicrobiae bacterium]|nr:UDP-N-acetylmuramoyl-tripeptide--D-alanyl-D-alanine ligase [Verrucomicrobiae bacterium]